MKPYIVQITDRSAVAPLSESDRHIGLMPNGTYCAIFAQDYTVAEMMAVIRLGLFGWHLAEAETFFENPVPGVLTAVWVEGKPENLLQLNGDQAAVLAELFAGGSILAKIFQDTLKVNENGMRAVLEG